MAEIESPPRRGTGFLVGLLSRACALPLSAQGGAGGTDAALEVILRRAVS